MSFFNHQGFIFIDNIFLSFRLSFFGCFRCMCECNYSRRNWVKIYNSLSGKRKRYVDNLDFRIKMNIYKLNYQKSSRVAFLIIQCHKDFYSICSYISKLLISFVAFNLAWRHYDIILWDKFVCLLDSDKMAFFAIVRR